MYAIRPTKTIAIFGAIVMVNTMEYLESAKKEDYHLPFQLTEQRSYMYSIDGINDSKLTNDFQCREAIQSSPPNPSRQLAAILLQGPLILP